LLLVSSFWGSRKVKFSTLLWSHWKGISVPSWVVWQLRFVCHF